MRLLHLYLFRGAAKHGSGLMNTRRHLNTWRPAPARRPASQTMSAVLVGMILALGLGGVAGVACKAASVLDTPQIGDIATFRAQPAPDAGTAAVVFATHVGRGGGTCVLDEAAMAAARGSLLVAGRQAPPDGRFLVHWAGQGNSAAKQGCGTAADLLVNGADLRTLLDAGWSGPGYRDMTVTEAMAAYPPG